MYTKLPFRPNPLRIVSNQLVFKRREVLPSEPDTLWKIESGVARSLTWNEEGKVITLGFWGRGDIVGLPLSRIEPYQVECLSTVQMSAISPESTYLRQAFLVHAWKSEELLKIVNQTSLVDRLFQLLLWLANQFGKPVLSGKLLDLRLTHQDLGDTIGSSRVSVTRVLNQLEQEGKIERSRRSLVLFS
jgi:CRP-like cAMP-binding protein